jgi:hypothetical protein
VCYSLWYNAPTMLSATGREMTGIINKPLLLHPVGCLYYLYQRCTVKQISDNAIYMLIKHKKSVLWRVAKRLSYKEDARCLKVKVNGELDALKRFALGKEPHVSIRYDAGWTPEHVWTQWRRENRCYRQK